MTTASVEISGWSRRRWWLAILFVIAFQISLVCLLEKHSTEAPSKKISTPRVQLRPDLSLELFVVNDPTVFVLPHRNGFSGEAWLNELPPLKFQPPDWTEPAFALPLTIGDVGGNFAEFIRANASPPFETIATIETVPSVPTLYPVELEPAKTSLKIDGPLLQRRMLVPPSLPTWPSAELVTNSLVQLLVDAQGTTISAVLLSPGLRLKTQLEADARALDLAKGAQFEPAASATVGTMIFLWATQAPAGTNSLEEIP
jgi:hypothetical protein